jgi:hypothetical protein
VRFAGAAVMGRTAFRAAVLCLGLAPGAAWATSLSSLAASMQPGTWAEFTTTGYGLSLLDAGNGHHILEYADKACWDPVARRVRFVGEGHYSDLKFITYSDATNAWVVEPDPYWFCGAGQCIGHGYDLNAMDPATGDHYFHRFNTRYFYHFNAATSAWDSLPDIPQSVLDIVCIAGADEYFPELGGMVYVNGDGDPSRNGSVYLYRPAQRQWTLLGSNLPMGGYHNFAAYNPTVHAMLFGGGNGSRDIYRLDASGQITTLRQAPINLGIVSSLAVPDPVTGNYLIFGADKSFWEYDIRTDSWRLISTSTLPIHVVATDGAVWGVVAVPITTYGVTMFLKYDTSNPKLYLYKHAASTGGDVVSPRPISDLRTR